MLEFYGDVSGSEGDSHVSAAGYVASNTEWTALIPDWQQALRESGAGVFHATDFYAREGDFARLKEEPEVYLDLVTRFSTIAGERTRFGAAYGVRVGQEFDELATSFEEWWTPNGRMTATMYTATQVMALIAYRSGGKSGPISVHWEEGGGIGMAIEFWRWLKKRDEPWTRAYSGFETAKKTLVPSQVADLLAHEALHWFRAVDSAQKASVRTRPAFRRLMKRDRLTLALPKTSAYSDFAKTFRQFGEANRGGLDPRARVFRGKLPSERRKL